MDEPVKSFDIRAVMEAAGNGDSGPRIVATFLCADIMKTAINNRMFQIENPATAAEIYKELFNKVEGCLTGRILF